MGYQSPCCLVMQIPFLDRNPNSKGVVGIVANNRGDYANSVAKADFTGNRENTLYNPLQSYTFNLPKSQVEKIATETTGGGSGCGYCRHLAGVGKGAHCVATMNTIRWFINRAWKNFSNFFGWESERHSEHHFAHCCGDHGGCRLLLLWCSDCCWHCRQLCCQHCCRIDNRGKVRVWP